MADEKVTSNGNVDVWVIPAADLSDYRAPDPDEVNTLGLRVTPAVAWDGTTFPANTESNDVDDRSLEDRGNATSRGFAQFEATLSLFRPVPGDTTSEAAQAWDLLKTPRLDTYVITRVLQRTEGEETPLAEGDWISVFKMVSDTVNDDTEGEDSYKFIVDFLPQGELSVYTQALNTDPITVTALGPDSIAAGEHTTLRATMGGKHATAVVEWSTDDPTVATVSQNGVVTAVSDGTATITASHDAAADGTVEITVTV